MKRIVRLTESDLTRIVRRVIMEQGAEPKAPKTSFKNSNIKGLTFHYRVVNNVASWDENQIVFSNDKTGVGWIFNCGVGKIGAKCKASDCRGGSSYSSEEAATYNQQAFTGVSDPQYAYKTIRGYCAAKPKWMTGY